ncbi:hypothetical protein P4T04_12380 [Bacillus badius]|uniref:hypothetical protein n=1 Tax=Bacillus badius TaxID=1455 RepID=UPI001CBC05F3|nr:hypothetical protein [Bacillus badius]MED0667112.1 hypothetical protein [Bacillus badius]UAT31622.1 hypothetical protein K7T73_05180 [Bacillus badius]
MVNLNFDAFRKQQAKHKPVYVGSTKENPGVNDQDANGQGNTDLSPGASGRTIGKK